jgi:hypothetical protein
MEDHLSAEVSTDHLQFELHSSEHFDIVNYVAHIISHHGGTTEACMLSGSTQYIAPSPEAIATTSHP